MSLDNVDGHPLSGNVPVSSGALYVSLDSPAKRASAETSPADDAQEHSGVTFLRALDATGRHNLVAIGLGGEIEGRTFEPGAWEAMGAWIDVRNGRCNLYFSANEPRAGADHAKLGKHEIGLIRCVYGDADPKDGTAFLEERERLRGIVRELAAAPVPPTFVIDSGGGMQPIWALDTKLPAETHIQAAEEQGRGIARRIGGDHVQDISRILRLPGTLNIPKPSKRLRGQVERLARVSAAGQRWSLHEISAAIPPAPASRQETDARISDVIDELESSGFNCASTMDDLEPELRTRFERARQDSPALDRLWSGEAPREDASGSGYRAKLAALLGRAGGFSAVDYAMLAWVWPYAVQAGDDRETKLTARALARDWCRVGEPADVAQRHFDEAAGTVSTAVTIEAEAQKAKGLAWVDPSGWQDRPVTPPEWLVENWIPHKQVTLLYGDGGVGKTLIAQQLATAMAAGRNWLGLPTRRARVMCFLCEDSEDELHRRQIAINRALEVDFADLSNLRIVSRVSGDNILARFERDGKMVFREVYHQLLADAQAFRADLIIVDTLADIFGGNEIDRAQVSAFVKQGLGGLARAIDGSVIALGHPSQSGMTSGKGTSGSGAWNNAARSRLYLTDLGGNFRELENKKLNYGPAGSKLKLEWRAGALHAIAGTMMGEVNAATAFIPQLNDAAENAVIQSVAACHGMRMTDATTTRYAAPKVLRETQPELLKAFTPQEIEDAFRRLLTTGTIRSVPIGRDKSSRPISGFAVVTDNLSAPAAADDDIFA
ncbi:AAA family ATPase [Methylobacterium sp. WL9]|uniref:AAA family ATPase n=1 Tax=Methylobacterium sp. WL9 TaxID=2603898 RepID=UPI0011C86982|nr:AAA family ATPase [Methylobacterium sp. WL9]TXN20389.1 AAA family ATPase [Methylobacterium sp. WL9]